MAVRGLVVEKIGLPEQDDESTENIDTNNLGKDVCFSFYLHDIFGYVKDVQFVRGITADLTDSAMLGEQLHGFWNAAPRILERSPGRRSTRRDGTNLLFPLYKKKYA